MSEWLPLTEFPELEVSNEGRIRRIKDQRLMAVSPDGHGSLKIGIRKDGRVCSRSVSRLVAITFISEPPNATHVVAYKDDNPMNIVVHNLMWVPRWHAQEWAVQSKRTLPMREGRIRIEETGEIYENSLVCARAIHGIEKYIVLAARDPDNAIYMSQHYRWVL